MKMSDALIGIMPTYLGKMYRFHARHAPFWDKNQAFWTGQKSGVMASVI